MKTLDDFLLDEVKRRGFKSIHEIEAEYNYSGMCKVRDKAEEMFKEYIWEEACKAQKEVCADNAVMIFHDGFNKQNKQLKYFQSGADNLTVDKDSILNSPNAVNPDKNK